MHMHAKELKCEEPRSIRAESKAAVAWLEAARTGAVEQLRANHCHSTLVATTESSGWTALHFAAHGDHNEATQWLINIGASLDAKTACGVTAVHVAARVGSTACLELLLKARASPTLCDRQMFTPLHYAASGGSKDTVRLLLDAGASLDVQASGERATPLSLAKRVAATAMGVTRQRDSGEAVKLLEAESKRLTHWFRAARVADVAKLTELLSLAEDHPGIGRPYAAHVADVQQKDGACALMLCARAGRVDALRLLLAHGASVKVVDSRRRTAMHYLASAASGVHGLRRCLDVLLSAGAKAYVRDAEGHTPADVVSRLVGALLEERRGARERRVVHAEMVDLHAHMRRAERHSALMCMWRAAACIAGKLHTWHSRAIERVYAPGGAGFFECQADYEERAAKVARVA